MENNEQHYAYNYPLNGIEITENYNIKIVSLKGNKIHSSCFELLLNKICNYKKLEEINLDDNLFDNPNMEFLIKNFNKVEYIDKIYIRLNKFHKTKALEVGFEKCNHKKEIIFYDYCFNKYNSRAFVL